MTATYVLTAIFWCSAAAVIWPHVVYPLSLLLFPTRRHRTGARLPQVTLVISAFNEEQIIGEKLENALALEYPRELLEILVVSDASTDGTDDIVTGFADRGVRLLVLESRLGKSAGVNLAEREARGEVIVFSDANSMYASDALRRLVRHFADPTIGYVVGSQHYTSNPSAAAESESLYWSFETWLKQQESRVGSVVGGDGAIYAVRAAYFEPLRTDDISDFTLPLRIVVRGFRGVFDPEALCYEHPTGSFEGEFRRKVRIVTRSVRSILRVPQALNPWEVGLFAYELASHKVVRWLAPVFLVALAVATVPLAQTGQPVYITAALLQATLYLAACAGLIPGLSRRRTFYVPLYYVVMNVAAAAGVLGVMFGYRFIVWTPERAGIPRLPVTNADQIGGVES